MPEKQTVERAKEDKREGKSASTQAGEFVREEMHHVREGKHGAKSTRQAIAIGLSKARRSGVKIPRKGKSAKRRTSSAKKSRTTSRRRSQGAKKALGHNRKAASRRSLSKQGKRAASRRSHADRSRAAKKAARTRKRTTAHKRATRTHGSAKKK